MFSFQVACTSRVSSARAGVIQTPHGAIKTPAFTPVATNGALKHMDFPTAQEVGTQLVFCNTAHFLVNSTPDKVRSAGGLHGLTRRQQPFITDSSGFQVYSWGDLVLGVDTEQGVTFKSYRDGSILTVSPESSIQAQAALGADIILVLDELLGFDNASRETTELSMKRSHLWAERSWREHHRLGDRGQALYGIVHGGFYPDLRTQSAQFLTSLKFDGYAIGGSLGVGPRQEQAYQAVQSAVNSLPQGAPKHLLGIGDFASIKKGISLGLDTFDSSFPTKLARHGTVIFDEHTPPENVRKAKFELEFGKSIDPSCDCSTCQRYSLGYLHHLCKTHEPVLAQLLCTHNLRATHRFMEKAREQIFANQL